MWHQIQRAVSLLVVTAFIGLTLLCFLFTAPSAFAAIYQLEETPGQVVYQSRQTIQDQHYMSWQAIAFNRIYPDGHSSFYLRLVGFPGVVTIKHGQPLTLTNSLGQVLMAMDASSQIFTDANPPEPHVGQYDLQPILPQLQIELPWQLKIPSASNTAIILPVPSAFLQEWQRVAFSE